MDTGSLWPEKPMEPRKRPLWRPKRRLLGGEGVEKTLRTKFAHKSQAKTQNYLMCFALYAGNCLRRGKLSVSHFSCLHKVQLKEH